MDSDNIFPEFIKSIMDIATLLLILKQPSDLLYKNDNRHLKEIIEALKAECIVKYGYYNG